MGRRLLSIVVGLALFATGPALARPVDAATPGPARILVHFRADATAGDRARAIASVGGTIDLELSRIGVTRIALSSNTDATDDGVGLAALRVARDPAVLSAEPDATGAVALAPNDTLFLTDPGFGIGQWGLRATHVDRAWDRVRGVRSVIVAVIDTGIDAGHPDLAGVALPGAAFVSSPDPSCVPGSTIDDNGHGTHVAGLIAANGNNGIGIAGVAFGVSILPVKALDCTGAGLLSDVASAVIWATDHGARIINISLGSSAAQATFHDAIRYALGHNVFVVAAAGNCGTPSARCGSIDEPQYPGAYPEVFAVAATDQSDGHAGFSNQSPYVAVSAPGVRILSTTPTYPTTLSRANVGATGYAAFSGTSQAAPLVAGVAALMLSVDPSQTPAQLADRLRSTAADLGPAGPDPAFGAGRVDAWRAAVTSGAPAETYGAIYDISTLPARTSTVTPIHTAVALTNTSDFTWNAAGGDAVRLAYHWSDLHGNTVVWDGERTVLPSNVPAGASVTVQVTIAPPPVVGAYVLRVDLVRDGLTWFSAAGVRPAVRTIYVGGAYAARYSAAGAGVLAINPITRTLDVSLTNLGTTSWPAAGPAPVRLSYHLIGIDGRVSVWDGARAALPMDVEPGRSVVVRLTLGAVPTSTHLVWLDLVQEDVVWFSTQGFAAGSFMISVP